MDRFELNRADLEAVMARSPIEIDENGCHVWQRAKHTDGYGLLFTRDRKTRKKYTFLAHRVAWFLKYGSPHKDLSVCHTCDNPACVNTDHMFVGSHKINMRDMAAKGRTGVIVPKGLDHEEIKQRIANGEKIGDLARQYGVHRSTISKINRGAYHRKSA